MPASRMLLIVVLLATACRNATPTSEAATDEVAATRNLPRGGLMVSAFYVDAEAAIATLRRTRRLLADHAWLERQAGIRGISTDSVRREMLGRKAADERYLAKRAKTAGMDAEEYIRTVERRMGRVRLGGLELLLPSEPESPTAQLAGPPVCERGPRFRRWYSEADVSVAGDDVTATFSAGHTTDRPADQHISLLWRHNQQGTPSDHAFPSRRQLSICRDYATADHSVVWDRCATSSPVTASTRSIHTTSDVRYGGRTLGRTGRRHRTPLPLATRDAVPTAVGVGDFLRCSSPIHSALQGIEPTPDPVVTAWLRSRGFSGA